jgi:hypothetical protein
MSRRWVETANFPFLFFYRHVGASVRRKTVTGFNDRRESDMASAEQQYLDVASGARSAVERSTDLWKQGAVRFSEQAGVVSKLPVPDLDEAFDRYFTYLQRGIEVNRELAKQWTNAFSTLINVPQIQADWLGKAVRGHSEAISDWVTGEVDTVEQAARAQAEAIAEAKTDQARARYQKLTKAELTDLLGQRDLPRNGTVDELVDRLVDADTQ